MKLLEDIIAQRRTVKPERYTGETIADEVIWKILQSANWAPTHGFTEPWRFSVFTGDAKLELLNFLNALDDSLNGPNEVRNQKREAMIMACSHIISIASKRGENPKIPD